MTQAVYFARCVGTVGPIKIGCSINPEERIKTLSVWAPFPVELILTVPGGYSLEHRVHSHFADLHSHREWFRAEPKLISAIDRLLAGENVEDVIDMNALGSIRKKRRRRERTDAEKRYQSLMMRMRWAERRASHARAGADMRCPESVARIVYRSGTQEPTAAEMALVEACFASPITSCVLASTLYPRRPAPAVPVSCVEALPNASARTAITPTPTDAQAA